VTVQSRHLPQFAYCLVTATATKESLLHTHAHTQTVLWLYGFCMAQPGCAATRRNIHPLTPIVVINRPLSASSTMIHGILPVQSTCLTVFFHNLSPSFLWPVTLHFILHTFLHPIIVFFSQHMQLICDHCGSSREKGRLSHWHN